MSASARTTHVTLPKGATLPVGITIERPQPGCDRHAALFYLHGGGLLYGVRDDLPRRYVDIILGRGLTLVTADYPLAPQVQIGAILNAVEEVFRSSSDLLPAGRTFLCGRSAGAYLALMLAHRLGQSGEAPAGVADFYGYCNLAKMRAALFQPSLHYRRTYALVAPRTARRLAGTEPLSSTPLERRLDLYVYARQTGNWGSLLAVTPSNLDAFSLDAEAQQDLPPLFIAASRDDEDVPFQNATALAAQAPTAETFFVDEGGHDFDRDLARPEGMAAWNSCLDWAGRKIL